MRSQPIPLVVAAGISLLIACGTGQTETRLNETRQLNLQGLAHAMDAIARGKSTVSHALEPVVPLPPPAEVQPPRNLQTAGFLDVAGYVVREVEIRIRRGGIDSSRLVLAHLEPKPCANIETLAVLLDAAEAYRIPPSPHAPVGTPGVRGYTAEHPDGGKLQLSASTVAPNCVTLITAQQPLTQARRYERTFRARDGQGGD